MKDRGSGLEQSLAKALEKRRAQSTLRQLSVNPESAVDFSSNDFLSLATSSELRRVFLNELENDPSVSSLGSGGSRLLDGNSTYAEHLENDIAAFHRAPAGLLCNSGFDANVSLFSCLPQPGDVIIYDELIHASVHDGMKLSRASKSIPFGHNDVDSLRKVIGSCLSESGREKGNFFVAVEAVYSMDGDIAALNEIVALIKDMLPDGNGHVIVDEAHSTGVLGPQGRGLVCQLGLEDEILVRLHTFGKALACNGAILLCNPTIRQYLINYARPLIYTTFMSYPSLAAIRTSYDYLIQSKAVRLVEHLQALIKELHDRLEDLEHCLRLPPHLSHLMRPPPLRSQKSPISYVLSSKPKSLATFCQDSGFVVRGIVPPTVPVGGERIRICLHAGNTTTQAQRLVECIRHWVERERGHLETAEGYSSTRARL